MCRHLLTKSHFLPKNNVNGLNIGKPHVKFNSSISELAIMEGYGTHKTGEGK